MNWNTYFKIMMIVNQLGMIMMDGRITVKEALSLFNMAINLAEIELPGDVSFVINGDELDVYVGDVSWMTFYEPMLTKLNIDLG